MNGGYVVLEDQEEMEALEEATSQTIDVIAFVDAAKVSLPVSVGERRLVS